MNERMSFLIRLTMMMMMVEMRIRPEVTGPINWILFCPWLATRWDWGTCGGSLISPSKTAEVRVYSRSRSARPGLVVVVRRRFFS